MSVYDEIVSAVLIGDTVKIPVSVNNAGLRSCFFREKKALERLGHAVVGQLEIKMSDNGQYKTVRLRKDGAIAFEIVTGSDSSIVEAPADGGAQ